MNSPQHNRPLWHVWIAFCCLTIIAALVLGVGLGSHLVLRHIVQTAPLWLGVFLGLRRAQSSAWITLPLFVFWFALMVLIWLYLLGISHFVNGHFSGLEIAMTIIVGLAAVVGVGAFLRSSNALSWIARAGLFILPLVIQIGCFFASFMPSIAHR